MSEPRPRMEVFEPRRLLAFADGTGSSLTGTDFQTVSEIVATPGGYVQAGLFGPDTDFGNGLTLQPRGRSDAFLTIVKGAKTNTIAIGGESRLRLRFNDEGRVDFAALPLRANQDFVFGVNAEARRADEYVSAMKLGPDGKLYVSLLFRRSVSLDTQSRRGATLVASDGFEDEYFDSAILRYDIGDAKFELERAFQIGGPFNDLIQDFDFDASGNIVVAGSFERRADFRPGGGETRYSPEGRGDAFVAKYSVSGKLRWFSRFGSDSSGRAEIESAYGVAVDADDNVYVGGTFAGEASFARNAGADDDGEDGDNDSGETVAEADELTDGFTAKLTAAGALAWVRVQGGADFDGIRDVALAPGGGVYSVGYFEEEADVNPRPDREQLIANDGDDDADTDLFFTRFDADGGARFTRQLGGTGTELIASAGTSTNGDLIIAGSFYGTADFDPMAGRRRITTPESDNDDSNEERDNAYSGFVARYGQSNGALRDVQTVDGRGEQDAFVVGASVADDGRVLLAGRYRDGFSVPDSRVSVRSGRATDDEYREDGFSLVFDDGFAPIV